MEGDGSATCRSNNSVAAVESYLNIHDLSADITFVSGRASADIALLKPSTFLVVQAMERLSVAHSRSALIGDSTTGVEASRAAQVTAVGYANKPGKQTVSRLQARM